MALTMMARASSNLTITLHSTLLNQMRLGDWTHGAIQLSSAPSEVQSRKLGTLLSRASRQQPEPGS